MKLWGGRFSGASSEVFERFSRSLDFDRELLEPDVRGSQAFARALARVGILSDAEAQELVTAFEQILTDAEDAAFWEGATDEDVHTLVIRKLSERTPLASKIHTGRSRNEQVSLDTRLWLRAAIDAILLRLQALMGALLDLAERYPDAVIPGYTHLKRAQAVLWPHYLLAYFEMFARDAERLAQARARVNVLPLGSGALAGSGFPLDRKAIAADLGFDAITLNSMDVSADRDFELDFLYAASLCLLHLSRLAEDWILYSSDEFGWMTLGDNVTSGSSLMPQKKNPDSLELIRGKSGRVFGALTSLWITMKGLPMTYNRDLQEDKEPLFDAARQCLGSLEMAAEVARSLVLHPAVPAQAAQEGWLVATDLAEELARSGVPFHEAHKIVGALVLRSVEESRRPDGWTLEQLQHQDARFTIRCSELLADPKRGMATRELPGGTGPAAVAAALAQARARLLALRGLAHE
jgi:argininosuccinate lyase